MQCSTSDNPSALTISHHFPYQPGEVALAPSTALHDTDVAGEQSQEPDQDKKTDIDQDCDISLLQIVSTAIKDSIADRPQGPAAESPPLRRPVYQGTGEGLDQTLAEYFSKASLLE